MNLNNAHHTPVAPLLALPLLLLALVLGLGGCINTTTNNPEIDAFVQEDETAVEDTPPAEDSTPAESTPDSTPTTGLKQLFSGANHVCAIKNEDSSLWCWGSNDSAQLANGVKIKSSTAKKIISTTAWTSLSGGRLHSCGIKEGHSLSCWGENSDGQIGNNTLDDNDTEDDVVSPITIDPPTADTTWLAISTGTNHTCGILSDKTLWCWGGYSAGQLGINETDPALMDNALFVDGSVNIIGKPTPSFDTNQEWIAVSSGNQFSCGIREVVANSAEGDIYCWGSNTDGQLGTGNTTDQIAPSYAGPDSDWIAVKTGFAFTCGIKANQSLYCWGDNNYGQLGQGNTTDQTTPTQVGSATDWASISTGYYHACGIKNTDELWCWGNNDTGQLGIGSTAHRATPTQISNTRGWLGVATGESHTCALDKDYIGYCWGLNSDAQLGNSITIITDTPTRFDTSTNWQSLDSGRYHTCGLKDDSTLWCGGLNSFGQLGNGSTTNQSSPIQVTAANGTVTTWASFATGHHHTCAISADLDDLDAMYCWGKNSHNQISAGSTNNIAANWSPAKIGADTWTKVSTGANHTCAIRKTDSTLWCQGDNSSAQLGQNDTAVYSVIKQVGLNSDWTDIASGETHSCGIRDDGGGNTTLWCWGKNDLGQLGRGDTATYTDVQQESTAATDWASIKIGSRHSCAAKTDKTLYCWGDDTRGQTGSGAVDKTVPNQVIHIDNSLWGGFDLGEEHTCAFSNASNSLYCWGDNTYQQLTTSISNPPDDNRLTSPTVINNPSKWYDFALGKEHSCGISQNDAGERTALCWGTNAEFQLGDDSAWKTTPQQVTLQ